jgi:anti-anti-sigma factor
MEVALMEPSPNSFAADLVYLNGDAIVVLRGDLDMRSAPELAGVLKALIDDGPSEVVVECSALSFIDSSGVSVLVSAQRRLEKEHRRLLLRSPRRNVVRVFEITQLMEFLNVDIDAAPVLTRQPD